MPSTRLDDLPYTELPVKRDSIFFIERDIDDADNYVSEKVDAKDLLTQRWETITVDQSIAEGEALIVDTTLAVVTVTLPVTPEQYDVVYIADYAGTFGTNNCVVDRNGENIMGLAENLNIDSSNVSLALQYIDATVGWRIVS